MINLTTGENEIYLTLTEKLTSDLYGFIFCIKQMEGDVIFTDTVVETTDRADEFAWVVNSGTSTFDLTQAGITDYEVYEKLLPIISLNIDDLDVIEQGKLFYHTDPKIPITKYKNTVNTTKKIYRK